MARLLRLGPVALAAAVSCGLGDAGDPGDGVCSALCPVAGVSIEVVDASSGAPVAGATASGAGLLRCESWPATEMRPPEIVCHVGDAGTYAVDVSAAGYAPARATVVVGQGPAPCRCVGHAAITVQLAPTP